MTDLHLLDGAGLRAALGPVADLLALAYPAGSLRMDRQYLEWALGDEPDSRGTALGVVGGPPDAPVGFAGACPARLQTDGWSGSAHIVSFVAVAPEVQGQHLARRMYERLLGELAREYDALVLTFARAGTAGAHLIETVYPALGWHGTALEPMLSWGIPRRRIAALRGDSSLGCANPTGLRLAADPSTALWIESDPRLVHRRADGTRILSVPLLGDPDVFVGSIDMLPEALNAGALVETLHGADAALPHEVSQIIVPNLDVAAAMVAGASGLRRLPGPGWRAWLWSSGMTRPSMRCSHTAVPII